MEPIEWSEERSMGLFVGWAAACVRTRRSKDTTLGCGPRHRTGRLFGRVDMRDATSRVE